MFCSPAHPLASRRTVAPAELDGQPWCLLPRLNDARWQFAYRLMSLVEEIDIVLESDSTHAITAAVAAGIGIGCLPRPSVERALDDGLVVELEVAGLDLQMPLSIVVRDGLTQSPAHATFVDHLVARR